MNEKEETAVTNDSIKSLPPKIFKSRAIIDWDKIAMTCFKHEARYYFFRRCLRLNYTNDDSDLRSIMANFGEVSDYIPKVAQVRDDLQKVYLKPEYSIDYTVTERSDYGNDGTEFYVNFILWYYEERNDVQD